MTHQPIRLGIAARLQVDDEALALVDDVEASATVGAGKPRGALEPPVGLPLQRALKVVAGQAQ